MAINLRPHHVLCSIGFVGHGYDAPFTANMVRLVMGTLRAPGGRDEAVLITGQADTICAPCPHRDGLGCEFQAKIDGLDARHAEALDLSPGTRITWGEALDRVRTRVVPDDLDRLCDGCRWLSDGTCKAALTRLRDAGAGTSEDAA
ncbi:MAG: DUF1284 domain-containing protein [Pseudomonadota bacterium]